MKINKKFQKVAVYGISGGAIGIVVGLFFGLIIGTIAKMIEVQPGGDGPADVAGFLGMSFGAIIGSVACSIAALMENE